MSAIVFVGPSWPELHRAPPAGIVPRPPARAGDLLAALATGARAIGLIDGVFETGPSVGHKEILHVLAAGVPVVGGASLGALRAAELAPFGMGGVGRVFACCRAGTLLRDDAVMVLHMPAELGWQPLTVALVDMLDTIDALPGLDPGRRGRLRDAAGRLPFRERDWPALAAAAEDAALAHRLAAAHVPTKRQDARAVVAALLAGPPRPDPARAALPRTSHFRRLLAAVSAGR